MTHARIHPLPPNFPAPWTVAYGEDQHGLWEALSLNGVRQVMRWIPPGHFLMGSPDDEAERSDSELPHTVVLTRGFWLADTACTQALWKAVVGGNPSRFSGKPSNPVETVTWRDVTDVFLKQANVLLPALDLRLPSEAEWEYACRADAMESVPFSFGTQISSEQVNFDGNEPLPGGTRSKFREQTVPVKSLPCNKWGLFEMHGNVWEWCQDWLQDYPQGPLIDPVVNATSGAKERVLRGGSWFYGARYQRSAARIGCDPNDSVDYFGFRLARGA